MASYLGAPPSGAPSSRGQGRDASGGEEPRRRQAREDELSARREVELGCAVELDDAAQSPDIPEEGDELGREAEPEPARLRSPERVERSRESGPPALARRGLTAAPRIDPSGGWNVGIHYEREETEWLLRDVLAPLELWMADQGLDSVAVQVGERLHVVGRAEQPYRAAAAAA